MGELEISMGHRCSFFWWHRGGLIQMAAEHIMHIQKALDEFAYEARLRDEFGTIPDEFVGGLPKIAFLSGLKL